MRLVSCEGMVFDEDRATVEQSRVLEGILEVGVAGPIPLPVDHTTLAHLLDYCRYHSRVPQRIERGHLCQRNVDLWDESAVNRLSIKLLSRVMSAANFLYIEPLVELCLNSFESRIEDMSAQSIHELLNLPHFTPEEEEHLRRIAQAYLAPFAPNRRRVRFADQMVI